MHNAVEQDISHFQGEMDVRNKRISTYRGLIEDKEVIQEGLAKFKCLRRLYEDLNLARERFDGLAKRRSDLEREIETARVRLEERVIQLERRGCIMVLGCRLTGMNVAAKEGAV